jgi:hypothetical protein
VRKASSIRLGLLLAVAALLVGCEGEKPKEKRCVDADGQFVDDGLCSDGAPGPDGGTTSSATGSWDSPDGGPQGSRGGFHFIWIPYGMYGGVGSYAPGYVRSGAGGGAAQGPASSGSVSRGGFGATGAAHAGTSASGT